MAQQVVQTPHLAAQLHRILQRLAGEVATAADKAKAQRQTSAPARPLHFCDREVLPAHRE
eukprot:CAMPEP_0202056472 /NCGR_PEP_ID=MMETSP0963-20130614/24233_1 /ASSEMBLY_ACC=CAM_ASM_000494 /TAXON_ID=4773 /ORGANISM="Schizochytrium aggregatum, Strain ATCC28209" /LENGTH=59 /DNA_ID=CAMNT_0048622223 /DNA_START=96 /DNA_END=275 /DNA_ORIENTATION=+